ncbi:PREDICTED: uncharacterized protein LOC109173966 [Ipomoea nil]|uniref:uncharacterized protein LOC109173966 n=1 Tax=Ipomoea nil TaxID=35883 RepID=UPI00090179C8|nr:PREDICTED: uncharacterized protein LOC109173966 [Ipomoea nil]
MATSLVRNVDKKLQNNDIATTPTVSNVEYCDLGDATNSCEHCGALFWFEERQNKTVTKGSPRFSMCCNNGKITLPTLLLPPKGIIDLFFGNCELSRKFLQNIRTYNNMFCFTSMRGRIDRSVNKGGEPPVIRLNGQNYHLMGSLLPEEGKSPHFAQLYIYDTSNEQINRINVVTDGSEQDDIHIEIVNVIHSELDKNNVLVKSFRMAKAEMDRNSCVEVKIKLLGKRKKDARTYNLPQVSEVAALIVRDLDTSIDGYREDIAFSNIKCNVGGGGRQRISLRELFCYRIQTRNSVASTILHAKRLFQQFVVDGYTMVESGQLIYIRTHQKSLRCKSDSGLTNALTRGEINPATQGRRIILPSSFTGGSRLFKMKLDSLIAYCRKKKLFGSVAGVIYTIEFQKRGLQHAHILLFLEKRNEVREVGALDKIISAEIPDENTDVEYYKDVEEFMMHGSCGKARRRENGRAITKNGIALDNRYISPYEAVWRLFDFDIQLRAPSVERLNFHLPNQQSVVFANDDPVENIVNRPTIAQNFLEWFEANKTFPEARKMTYVEMPTKFVWKKQLRKWQPRKKG